MVETLATVSDRYSDEQIKGYYADGFWSGESYYQLAQRQAEAFGEARFVFDDDTSISFRELQESALRLAVGLARRGVSRGDRVAVQLPNWTEFVVASVALSRIGAVIVPIMPIYRDGEVGYVLEHSGAVAAITCGDFKGFDHLGMFTQLAEGSAQLGFVVAARSPGRESADAVVLWEDLLVEGDLADLQAEAGPEVGPDEPFLIIYTSGTTSRPKGCFHTFNTVRASAQAIVKSLDYTSDDIQFGPSPITHSTGIVTSVLVPLLTGASSYLMDKWEPVAGVKAIQEHGLTGACTATAFLQMIMAAHDPEKDDLSSLRFWLCAGSPIPSSVVETASARFQGCQVLSLYGRSENFLTAMCSVADPVERSATSDGRALDGAAIKVVDENGHEVPLGDEGDIVYLGPSHMLEYFRNPEETAAMFTADGFSRSGDLGRMVDEDFVRVTGRLKDIVIRGGMNISARELEEHLATHPKLEGVAVIGMPDERLGERVCAYVIAKDPSSDITLADVTDHLRSHGVVVQKLPERVEVVDHFPMTATGKIQKHLLRADIAAKLS